MINRVLILLIFFVITISPSKGLSVVYYDDPTYVGVGARVTGMGRAFTAISDDTNAILYNPAGLGNQKYHAISTMSTTFLDEYNYMHLSGVYPTKYGVWGAAYVSSRITGILVSSGGTTDFYNHALIVGYGKYIGDDLANYLGGKRELYGGLTVKYFSKGFSGDVQASGAGFNMDLGLKLQQESWLAYGLTLQNVLFGGQIAGDFDPEVLPFGARLGVAADLFENQLKLSLDKELILGRSSIPWPMHLGAEWHAHKNLYIRGGFDQVAGSTGGDMSTNLVYGVGLEYESFKVDFSYQQNFAETNTSTSVVSITLFGWPMQDDEGTKTEKKISERVTEAVPAPSKPIDQKINIITPQDKTYTFDSEITFRGKVDPDVRDLSINNRGVPFNSNGDFADNIPLVEGQNVIKVRIVDNAGKEGLISMSLARYYKPKNVTTKEAEGAYIDKVIIQTKVHDYLEKDYSVDDNISKEDLSVILSKIREAKKNEKK